MHALVNIAQKAAQQAGNIILRSMDKLDEVQITEKQKNDFVSEVDIAAERSIVETIRKSYPDHGIIAEEGGDDRADNDIVWIIDPLDGTRNFLHGFPHFAVSIAVREKGKIEHGVIYDPIRKEFFMASRGRGCRVNDRRMRIGSRKTLDQALLGTGFPYKDKAIFSQYMATFEALFQQSGGVRRAGACALDLAYVAANRLDGFWELGLKPWDIAAGALMIKEAGGLIGDIDGSENYLKSGNVVAANPKLFKQMLQIIQSKMAN